VKTVLYYFSGTGNTLMLARLLAEELGDTEIINIAACNNSPPAPKADAIGILYPVYALGLPKIMCNFVKDNLRIPNDTYVFSLSNYASFGGPASLHQLKTLLQAKGGKLQAGFGITMPSNDIILGGAESQKKQNEHFLAATEEIKTIAQTIKKFPENYFYRKNRVPLFIARLCYKLFFWYCAKDAKKFYANDNCTSCGICVKICPTQNIKLVDNRPVWGNNCEHCMACLQWCPAVAIHRKGVPETRRHYHNPTVKAQDLIEDMQR
jgi:ferredoxin